MNNPLLLGIPMVKTVTVASGGGGDISLNFVVPAGQIWIPRYIQAYHDDAARTLSFFLVDVGSGTAMLANALAAVPTSTHYPLALDLFLASPPLSAGAFGIRIVCYAMAGAKNLSMDGYFDVIKGVAGDV